MNVHRGEQVLTQLVPVIFPFFVRGHQCFAFFGPQNTVLVDLKNRLFKIFAAVDFVQPVFRHDFT